MIEKMKKATIVTLASRRHETVAELRDLGLVHIIDLVSKSDDSVKVEKENENLSSVLSALEELVGKNESIDDRPLDGEKLDRLVDDISSAVSEKKMLSEKLVRVRQERDRAAWLGNFDPSDLEELAGEGISLSFYSIGRKDKDKLAKDDGIRFVTLSEDKTCLIAVLSGTVDRSYGASPVDLPTRSLAEMDEEILVSVKRIEEIGKILLDSRVYIASIKRRIATNEEDILFLRAEGTFADDDSIVHIQGYFPAKDESRFVSCAEKSCWAYLIEDPSDEDTPPTLVTYKGIVRIVKPVFDILGTVPGYREYDISTWFLAFFSLFFAMIIGDAGYGLVFLVIAILMHVKSRKASDLNILLYVLSGFTIVWGSITGTWFGSKEVLVALPFLQKLVIPSLANYPELFGVSSETAQNSLMQFCFILGTIQLSLACVLNIVHKAPNKDLSWVGDLGWLMEILVLYLLVLYLAIGKTDVNLSLVAAVVGIGFVLVCVFGSQAPGVPFSKGLKSGLGGFFTTFLNTVSCFSNIMSYIRLFAVGMASLAIAQSFNGMAEGMLSGWTLPAGVLVIIIGHTLNLVMGLLSVVVHGVRLNLLEFSGQLGMEWSGYNYEPFCAKGTR